MHEKLLVEENNLKENLQNEVTKTKEKFEIDLSKCQELLRINERIKKGINIMENEKEKEKKYFKKFILYIIYK